MAERPTATPPYVITKTRSKRYVGQCSICGWTTNAHTHRIDVGVKLRDHCRLEHDTFTEDIFNRVVNDSLTGRKGQMKQPGTDLPEVDRGERLADYDGHLVVITDARPGSRNTQHGIRETREALVYVYVSDGWKAMGETPIFFKTVIRQIDEEGNVKKGVTTEPVGGKLIKGTERNANEWAIVPVDGDDLDALNNWSKENAESF